MGSHSLVFHYFLTAPKVYEGTLLASPIVPFGGGEYCKYEVTLEKITMRVEVLSGEVQRATVGDTVREKAFDCPYEAMAPHVQAFDLMLKEGWQLTLDGKNQVRTRIEANLVAKEAGYEATVTWKRTDQPAPLDWKVTAKILLTAKVQN